MHQAIHTARSLPVLQPVQTAVPAVLDAYRLEELKATCNCKIFISFQSHFKSFQVIESLIELVIRLMPTLVRAWCWCLTHMDMWWSPWKRNQDNSAATKKEYLLSNTRIWATLRELSA